MSKLPLPKAWVTAGVKPIAKQVVARIDMSAEVAGAGLCPECRKPMDKSNANGIPVYVCHSDRIAIPMPDDESITASNEFAPGVENQGENGPSTSQSLV